jgi:hypothetical protein
MTVTTAGYYVMVMVGGYHGKEYGWIIGEERKSKAENVLAEWRILAKADNRDVTVTQVYALPEIWDKMATDMRTLTQYGDQILL